MISQSEIPFLIRLLRSTSFLRAVNEHETRCGVIIDTEKGVAHLVTLNTPGGELILVTSGTVNLLFARNKALGTNRILAHHTAEALLVPLSGLVFHLLGA